MTLPEDFTGLVIDNAGIQHQYKEGRYHSFNDKPAIVCSDAYNYKIWFKEGKSHREKGLPADIWWDGNKTWYVNGIMTGKFISNRP